MEHKDDVFSLGWSMERGDILISEKEREAQIHVLGAPGEGKSKFLEHLMRHDIDRLKADEHLNKNDRRSCGLCLIDPSAGGETMYDVLAYCAQIDFRKVLIIDPQLMEETGRYPIINPLYFPVTKVLDSFRTLFGVKDPAETAVVETYLRAILEVLQALKLPLSEALPFVAVPLGGKDPDIYTVERNKLFSDAYRLKNRRLDVHLHNLSAGYRNYTTYKTEIGSTARRLYPVELDPIISTIFGGWNGLDFRKLVSEGWVVLVNVSDSVVGKMEGRFLATVVINQIIDSIEQIGSKKPYHLYIDEAGQYATRKVADVLNLKRKIGLRLILAHQFMTQFEDKFVEQAVKSNTKIKVAFYMSDTDDRDKVVKMLGYGGKIGIDNVSYNLGDQAKQQMVIRLNKQAPILCKAHDVPDCPRNPDFITKILSTDNYERRDIVPVKGGGRPDSQTISKNPKQETGQRPQRADKASKGQESSPETKSPRVRRRRLLEESGGQDPSE